MISAKATSVGIQISESNGPDDKWAHNYIMARDQEKQCLSDGRKCKCGVCLCCVVTEAVAKKRQKDIDDGQ